MKITLVRHTSVAVPKGICYGISDVSLAPTFRSEMDQIWQKIGSEKFDAIISSPLIRCTIPATELARKLSVQTDSRLTELNFGDWEMAEWSSIFESPEGKNWFADYVNTRCPNGESFIDLTDRIKSFIADLQKNSFNRVLIVTHAGILRAMICLLQGKSPKEAFNTPLEYGQIISFNIENDVH